MCYCSWQVVNYNSKVQTIVNNKLEVNQMVNTHGSLMTTPLFVRLIFEPHLDFVHWLDF